jgi:histidinol-phosphate aminotransferase
MSHSFDINTLIRSNILRLKPYRSARDDFKEGVLLDANENPFPPEVSDSELTLNRYPDPHYETLRASIAVYRKVSPNSIFLGNGSDEAIDLLIRASCTPGKDRILTTPPTYGMYQVSADINDVETIKVPLNSDFSLNVDEMLKFKDEVKITFLCSPNNPTANILNTDSILKIVQNFSGFVVVDEAYIDFASEHSLLPRLSEFPNLIILQTMSKAFGLAGIRLGMAFASPEIVRILMSIKPPYNINALTQKVANQAFKNPEIVQSTINDILDARVWLKSELQKLSVVKHIFPSDANFLLVRFDDPLTIYKQLAQRGVIVRYRGDQIHCDGCLRITIGTHDENQILINLLSEFQ